ncbi:hypothetical protein [Tenacibaculum xiamenense]|uniref:hypothetical protein n=1 Tax=Tenacibaculum xiamenense TaxID=1261553 RepID=UPI00389333C4
MGENKHVDELDNFMKKYVKEIEVESPSIDFTKNIMNSINTMENSEVFKAKPLISTKVWIVLGAILIVSMFFVSKGQSFSEMVTIPELENLPSFDISNISIPINVSDTMLYTCFFFTIMVFVQIYMLKDFLTRRSNL